MLSEIKLIACCCTDLPFNAPERARHDNTRDLFPSDLEDKFVKIHVSEHFFLCQDNPWHINILITQRIIVQVCLGLVTIKGHSNMWYFTLKKSYLLDSELWTSLSWHHSFCLPSSRYSVNQDSTEEENTSGSQTPSKVTFCPVMIAPAADNLVVVVVGRGYLSHPSNFIYILTELYFLMSSSADMTDTHTQPQGHGNMN